MTQQQYDAQLAAWVLEAETTLAKRELDPETKITLVKAILFNRMNSRIESDPEFEKAMLHALALKRAKLGAELTN